MNSWYCCDCGDGQSEHKTAAVCTSCGAERRSSCTAPGELYYGATETVEKVGLSNREQSGVVNYVDSERTIPWYGFGRSTWTEPLMHMGLFSLASVAALDVAGEHGAWSFMPWTTNATCHNAPNFDHSEVRDKICCGRHTIVSTIVFTAAATTVHHLRREDCYQDVYLFASITCGVGIGLCLGNNLHDMMFSILPWAILMGLLCSILIHRFWNCDRCCTSDDER